MESPETNNYQPDLEKSGGNAGDRSILTKSFFSSATSSSMSRALKDWPRWRLAASPNRATNGSGNDGGKLNGKCGASEPERPSAGCKVTALGPAGPSFRPRGHFLPASGRQSGSIHGPSPEVLRLIPIAKMFLAALTSASRIDLQLVQTKRERLMRLSASTAWQALHV